MSGELVWAVVRMLVTLPIVLGLIYLVLKYGLARRYATTAGNRRMRLVEQLPLGPKSALSLVTLGGVYYLLAHQENSISLVKELGELPEMNELEIAGVVELTPHSVQDYDSSCTAARPLKIRPAGLRYGSFKTAQAGRAGCAIHTQVRYGQVNRQDGR